MYIADSDWRWCGAAVSRVSICCSHAGRDPVSGKKSNTGGIFLCHVAGELYGHRKLLLAEEATAITFRS